MAAKIDVEVAIAFPSEQRLRSLSLAAGSTAAQAVELSGFIAAYPELGDDYAVGIFGQILTNPNSHQLNSGDRVEIYRPLSGRELLNKPPNLPDLS